jgi:hypothetical protein
MLFTGGGQFQITVCRATLSYDTCFPSRVESTAPAQTVDTSNGVGNTNSSDTGIEGIEAFIAKIWVRLFPLIRTAHKRVKFRLAGMIPGNLVQIVDVVFVRNNAGAILCHGLLLRKEQDRYR